MDSVRVSRKPEVEFHTICRRLSSGQWSMLSDASLSWVSVAPLQSRIERRLTGAKLFEMDDGSPVRLTLITEPEIRVDSRTRTTYVHMES